MPATRALLVPPRALPVLLLLLLALSSTGCASRPVMVTRNPPAELVRPCPAEPERSELRDDRDLFLWISRALEAGAECRAAHEALSKWAGMTDAQKLDAVNARSR